MLLYRVAVKSWLILDDAGDSSSAIGMRHLTGEISWYLAEYRYFFALRSNMEQEYIYKFFELNFIYLRRIPSFLPFDHNR